MMQASKHFFLISTCLVTLSAAACTPVVSQRGNLLEERQIEEVTPLTSTRSDVLRTLGSPTTRSTFNSNVWYYIGQETKKRGIFDPKVVEERIVLVAFNDEGFVETIQDVDRERINVPYEKDQTPTHGNKTTAAQQFLGNLGKFNPNTGQ